MTPQQQREIAAARALAVEVVGPIPRVIAERLVDDTSPLAVAVRDLEAIQYRQQRRQAVQDAWPDTKPKRGRRRRDVALAIATQRR